MSAAASAGGGAQGHFECTLCGGGSWEPFLDQVADRLGVQERRFSYARCRDCGLVALSPRPTFEETAAFYPPSFWRTKDDPATPTLAKRFEAYFRERLVQADFALVSEHFRRGLRHLDVGCATGDFIELCRSRGTSSRGIELSASAVEYCRSVRGLDVTEGDLVGHDFGGDLFDIITYNGVLEHVPDPHAHLRKCREILAPGGKLLVLGIPNIDSAGFRLAGTGWIGLDVPRHIHQFSRESLTSLFERAGFRVTAVEPRSPRFNPPSLIASAIPALHRHHFDAYEARTGRNPLLRKAALLVLIELVRPLDAVLCRLGLSEHLTFTAEANEARRP